MPKSLEVHPYQVGPTYICLLLTTPPILTFGHYSVVPWIDQTMSQVDQFFIEFFGHLYPEFGYHQQALLKSSASCTISIIKR
jgi:hypothetical protein